MGEKRLIQRTEPKIRKINLLDIKDGVYLAEKSFGTIHQMKKNPQCIFHIDEFMYYGKLHKGYVAFYTGADLKQSIPVTDDEEDHGYTFEGIADKIFRVENALDIFSTSEKRTFAYINGKSRLLFVGDPDKSYDIYIRIYDNAYGKGENYRWLVIYAEESL